MAIDGDPMGPDPLDEEGHSAMVAELERLENVDPQPSRLEQGLPSTVTDAAALARIAGLVASAYKEAGPPPSRGPASQTIGTTTDLTSSLLEVSVAGHV